MKKSNSFNRNAGVLSIIIVGFIAVSFIRTCPENHKGSAVSWANADHTLVTVVDATTHDTVTVKNVLGTIATNWDDFPLPVSYQKTKDAKPDYQLIGK